MRSDLIGPVAIATVLALGCSGTNPTSDEFPANLSIAPSSGYTTISVPVVISGAGFLAKASQPSSGGEPTLDTHHRAWLGTTEIAVTWQSTTTLDATVPDDLGPGTYDLTVENALGNRGKLEGAYTVLEAPVFAGAATVDHPTVNVGQMLTLTFTVKNNGSGDITSFALGTPTYSSTDGGSIALTGAAPSAPSTIAAGETRSFTWQYIPDAPAASKSASISIAVAATGVESLSGKTLTAAPPAPVVVTIVHAPAALTATAWSASPTTSAVNKDIDVTLTLTNTAGTGAAAANVTAVVPSIAPAGSASCTPATPAASEGAPVSIADGQSATFHWTCKATAAGTYALDAAVTARDALTGADVAPALAEVRVTVNPNAPGAPTGVKAAAVSHTQIDLTWKAVPGATGYIVLTSTASGGPYSQIGTPAAAKFSNAGLSAGTTYFYVVRARNAGGTSGNSVEVSATTVPAAPAATATAVSQTQIDLGWKEVQGATGYVVLTSTASGGPYTQIATPTAATFSHTGLSAGTTYFYVVRATNAAGTSGNSAEVTATTLPDPPPLLPVGPVVRPAP
jgi:hypothetical protein